MKSISETVKSSKTSFRPSSANPGVHRRDVHRAVVGRDASRICFCCEQRLGFGAEYYRQQAAHGVVVMHRVCPADPFFADCGELVEASSIGGPEHG